MKKTTVWDERIDQWWGLPESLWNRFGLMMAARAASLFSLPIEGAFWYSVMNGDSFAKVASYALPFTLDLIADLLVYRFGRIQQTVNKGTKKWKASRIILVFVFFNAVQSWGTAAWQLNNSMRTIGWWWPVLFGMIQPMIGAGVSWTLAVQDGKFDEEKKATAEQSKPKRKPGKPDHDWWKVKLESMNGGREQMTPEGVRGIIEAEYTEMVSGTTLYNWSKEAQQVESS